MIPKSKIRQTALTVIYAVITNGGDPKDVDWPLLWSICEEKETDHCRIGLCKALDHLCRSNADFARLLEVRATAVQTAMEGDLTSAPLREKLERYLKNSNEFDAALAAMRYSMKDKRRDSSFPLHLCSKDVLGLASIVFQMGEDLIPAFADFPAYRKKLDSLASAIRRRGRQMASCAELEDPAAVLKHKEFAGWARQAQDLVELRPAAQELAMAVLTRREELDAILAPLLQNYSPDRLDVLDKCILYLSLYELKFNKLETPIVVSEATALANEYSSGKSAPFIHGVIAAASSKD